MTSDEVVEQRAEPLSREELVRMLADALLAWHDLPGAPPQTTQVEAILDARELLRVIEENQAALRRPVAELGG